MSRLSYRHFCYAGVILLICLGGLFFSKVSFAGKFDLSALTVEFLALNNNQVSENTENLPNQPNQIQSDANTLLFLNFDNTLTGEQGEIPNTSSGFSYESGIEQQSVFLGSPNQLIYPSQNNINALEGTFEFWIKPNWNGNDSQQHQIFQWNDGAGVHISRDSANNLKIIANRFGTNPGGETFFNTSAWLANQWHHVAFTYSASQGQVKIYIDGQLKNTNTFVGTAPITSSSMMQLGGLAQDRYINAGLDDFIISNVARTEQEISQRYLSYLFSSLTFNPSPVVGGQSSTGTLSLINPTLNDLTVSLSSSNNSVLSVPPTVTVPANASSITFPINTLSTPTAVTVNITASIGDKSIASQVRVVPPCQTILPPQIISLWSGNDNGLDSVGSANNTNWTSFADGKIGRALSFSSSSRFLTGFSRSVQEVPNFTFEAWIRPTSSSGRVLNDLDFGQSNQRQSKLLYISNGTFFVGASGIGVSTNFAADIGVWQHIAYVVTPTTIYFYKNGVQFTTPYTYPGIRRDAGVPLYFGDPGNFSGFTGQLDEAAIYNRALSQTEIANIYNADVQGKCYTSELQSVTISPTTIEIGATATATVTLTNPAPSGGAQISLLSSDETLVAILSTVTIPAGETQTSFPINTLSSNIIKTLNINAVYQSSVRSALLTVTSRPDLQITTVNSPLNASTGTAFSVNAQIANTGTGIAEGTTGNPTIFLDNWTDAVYFSLDNQVGSDIRIGQSRSAGTTLAPNQNYTQTITANIPPSAITQDGDYYIYVRTVDPGSAPVRNEINTNNNVYFQPVHVEYKIADLQISEVTAPAEVDVNTQFSVSWKDINAGTLASGSYNDQLYFSTDNQVGGDILIGNLSQTTLAANQERNVTANVTVPTSAITQDGDYFIYVKTDSGNVVTESNENNNIVFRNIRVFYRLADLQVTNVVAPTQIGGGTQFNVSWSDLNAGNLRINTYWEDRVYFSVDNQIGGDILLSSIYQMSTVEPNQSTARSLNVTIPRSAITQDGDYFIYVRTDSTNAVAESNESNNITFRPINVYLTLPDLQVENPSPLTGISLDTPFQFSWSDKNAGNRAAVGPWKDKLYVSTNAVIDANDFVLGEYEFTETINPAQSVIRTKTLTIPSNAGIPNGSLYLIVQADSTNAIFEDTKENNNTGFSLLAADLQITNANSPAQSDTDSNFNVSWTDRNGGNWTANQTWNDRILLSTDNLPSANDTVLGGFPFANTLAPNATADRIQTISIPRNAVAQDGNYFLIIQADGNNVVDEGTNENNNFVAKPISVRKTPLPDLTIQSITAPDTAFFGQTIRVQWTVKNIGNGPTNAAEWQDWYYISSDNLPEIEDPFKAPLQNVSYLAAGENYTASADITIPQGLVGSYKILVWTDSDGTNHRTFQHNVLESDDSNNWNIARPIQINAPPLPDLQTTLVQAQEEVFAGQTMNLNWRVENRGDGTTPPNLTTWNDKIYLSQNTTFEPNIDRLIGSRQHDGRLLPPEGYSVNSFAVNVPNDIAGNWYVFVVADGDNGIFEFGNENNNSNYDREQPGSPMLIRATPPDLIIPNAINAPSNGNAAGQITVGWTVQNQGAFDAAPNWFDTVYLSNDATLDPATDTPLGTVARNAPLGAGLTYDVSANVTLPSCIAGNYYLFVYADSRKQIFEYDPNLDAEANNSSPSKAISITSSPSDLRVTTVSNPASAVAGQPATFSWTVGNQGTGTTSNSTWNDEVYLSPAATFDRTNSTRIGAFTHTGVLAVGASYSQTQNIVIPNTAQGNYYVFVLTDSGNNVEECAAANDNNSGGSPTILNVSNSLPDLTVTDFAFVNSLIGGQNADVSWTVTNSGNAAAQNSSWGDSVYFSTDNTLDGNDRKLADVIVEGGLSIGGTYSKNAQITLPIVAPGNYFLIVKADDRNFVFEGQGENNNARSLVLPIEIPPVDLQVSTVNAPANAFSGQNLTVDWTVANTGANQTIGSNWTDAIVLSLDQIDDPTDRVIGYLQHDGALGGGANYTATTDVSVPAGLAGQYYIFVRADRNNQLAEAIENNNTSSPKPVLLALAPPADLIVTNVGDLTFASPGESATFNWTVQNTGANPATGVWTDTVYLSTDQTWDIADVLVGRQTAGTAVAPGQTYNGTLTTALPAVNPGNYYVIVRADIRNRVIETNETNNTGVSGGTVAVDVPELQLGVPQSTTLTTGQERFYKFNAPPNETVRVSLDGQDGSSNELYTRFGQMPSRNAYDFFFDRLYEADQQLVIPNTTAGNYYNMIRGENVPNSLTNKEQKPLENQNIKPINSKQTISTENVTVKAEIVPFSITSVSPNTGGNTGNVTIKIEGAKFTEKLRVRLLGTVSVTAENVLFVDKDLAYATFNLSGVPIGSYNLELTAYSIQYNLAIENYEEVASQTSYQSSFSVIQGISSKLESKLMVPKNIRRGNGSTPIYVYYKNGGTNDVVVNWFQLKVEGGLVSFDNSNLINQAEPTSELSFLGLNNDNPAGVIPPGVTSIIKLNVKPKENVTKVKFSLHHQPFNNSLIDYTRLFQLIGSNHSLTTQNTFKVKAGATWKDLLTLISEQTTIIKLHGQINYNPNDLIMDMLNQIDDESSNVYETSNEILNKSFEKKPKSQNLACTAGCSFLLHTICPESCNRLRDETSKLALNSTTQSSFPIASKALAYFAKPDINPRPSNREIYNKVEKTTQYRLDVPRTLSKYISKYVMKYIEKNNVTCDKLDSLDPINVQLDEPYFDLKRLPESGYGWTYKNLFPRQIAEKNWLKHIVTFYPYPDTDLWGAFQTVSIGVEPKLKVKLGKKGNKVTWETIVPALFYKNYNFEERRNDGPTALCAIGPNAPILSQIDLLFFGQGSGFHLIHDCNQPTPEYLINYQMDLRGSFESNENATCCSNQSAGSAISQQDNSTCCQPDDNECNCPSGDCDNDDDDDSNVVNPMDPNEKINPKGFGVNNYIIKDSIIPYQIDFENVPTATASAQRVRITDHLDPNIDPRTFRLKEIGFGSYRLQVPENRAFYQQRVQLGAEFNNILADISAGVDISTGKVTWTLTAIDPATGELPNSAVLGLLPPNDATGRGQGFVTYTVQPKGNAPTGTIIKNNATIIFDTEEPITTNTVMNTLDADVPTSAVNALPPSQSNTTFTVSWSGTDAANGSGLQNYDVWVSENDGAYQPFVTGTIETTAQFTGILGRTYRFYSIARDNAGNVESAPAAPDAVTMLLAPTAANVTLSGRVRTASGGGISRAAILLTDQQGNTRTVSTNSFGYFKFKDVPAGATYVISVSQRRYRFTAPTRVLNVTESLDGLDFEAQPE